MTTVSSWSANVPGSREDRSGSADIARSQGNVVERSEPCQACRARKVKCDRRTGGCENCQRLEFLCSYSAEPGTASYERHSTTQSQLPQSPDSPNEYTLAGTQRKRTRKACRLCCLEKARCSGEATCSRCRSKGRECIYPSRTTLRHLSRPSVRLSGGGPPDQRNNPQRPEKPVHPTQIQASNSEHDKGQASSSANTELLRRPSPRIETVPRTLGLEKHVISHYIDAFFDLVQPNFCFFLNRASFIFNWNNGTLDMCQLRAVCGCSAPFVAGSSDSESPAATFMSQVEMEVLTNLGTISLVQLQNTFLLVYYKYVLHQLGSVWMLFSLCVRSAYAQGLNLENSSLSIFERESRRRLMWSIFLFDKLISGSLPDLTICTSKSMQLRLPCNERCFSYGIESKTPYLDQQNDDAGTQDMGTLAYTIKLIDIRQRMHSCIKPIIAEDSSPWYHEAELSSLEHELADFEKSLPSELKWSHENLALRSYTPTLTSYVMLHSWWYSAQCDLYRFLVPGIRESVSEETARTTPTDYVYSCRQKCLQSAIGHTKLWSMVHQLRIPRAVNDQLLAVHVYHCAQVLFFSNDLIIQQSEDVFESGFGLLKPALALVEDLSSVYPMLKDISKDITANFLGRNKDQGHRQLPDLRSQQSPERSLRNRLLSKYAMVPSVPEDIAYSSHQETEVTVLPSTQKDIEQIITAEFDSIEMLGPTPGALSRGLVSPHSDRTLQRREAQQVQEWSPLLLDESGTIEHQLIQNQDLSWMEGPDLVFFPGFYHGQINPYTRIFNT